MLPSPMNRHPFLRWYEVLLARLLMRSPRVRGLVIYAADGPYAWAMRKTESEGPIEALERSWNAPPAIKPHG